MSIRFSIAGGAVAAGVLATASAAFAQAGVQSADLLKLRSVSGCLLYTSDAADD